MPKVPKEELKSAVRAEVAPSRSVKKLFSLAHERATRAIVSVSLAAALASCSPAVSMAQDTTPAKGKPVAAAVEKDKKAVEYQAFSDPAEIEPYFKNAEGKFVEIKDRQITEIGDYLVEAVGNKKLVNFNIRSKDGTYTQFVPFQNPLELVKVLVIDLGENHPVVRGKLLVLADNETVGFQFFDKQLNKHDFAVVPLWEGGMRKGPIKTGYGMDDQGVFVINSPQDLKTGDVVCQAGLWNDGNSGGVFFKLVLPSEGSKKVAMR